MSPSSCYHRWAACADDAKALPGADVDFRARLLIVIFTSVAVLLIEHPAPLAALFIAGAGYMAQVRRWRVQLICYALLAALAVVSMVLMLVLGHFLPMMRAQSPYRLLIPFMRMAVMIHAIMALALTLRLRNVMRLMRRYCFPRMLYLPLTVAIRFLPGLIDDVKQTRDCLRLRGYSRLALLNPRLWLLPLVFRVMQLSDELATAAELKGIGYGRPAPLACGDDARARLVLPVALSLALLAGALVMERHLPEPSSRPETGQRQLRHDHPRVGEKRTAP